MNPVEKAAMKFQTPVYDWKYNRNIETNTKK